VNYDEFRQWVSGQVARASEDFKRDRGACIRRDPSPYSMLRIMGDAVRSEAAWVQWHEIDIAAKSIGNDSEMDDFIGWQLQSAIERLEGSNAATSGYMRAADADVMAAKLAILDECRRKLAGVTPEPDPEKATPEAVDKAIDNARATDGAWKRRCDEQADERAAHLVSDRMAGGAPTMAVRLARAFARAIGRPVHIIGVNDRPMTVRVRIPFGSDGDAGGVVFNVPAAALDDLGGMTAGDGSLRRLDVVASALAAKMGAVSGGSA
jgi:hypothetical protein